MAGPSPVTASPGRRPCMPAPPTPCAARAWAPRLFSKAPEWRLWERAPANSFNEVIPTKDYFLILHFMLLVLSIFQEETVFDDGSILYCLIKTKYLSSHPLASPSMELLSSIKTFLNLGLFQSYCKFWLWSALSANEMYNSVHRSSCVEFATRLGAFPPSDRA